MQQRALPVYRIETFKDEILPNTLEGLGGVDYAGKVFDVCPVAVAAPDFAGQLTMPFNDGILAEVDQSGPHLRQLSRTHRRSFEIIDPDLPQSWNDEYGNFYSSINLKGNNFSRATMIETSTATDGIIAYGLQESAPIQRVLRGSAVLRAAGVSTEYILGLAEPKVYPLAQMINMDLHTIVTRDEYKAAIVHNYWKELPEETRTVEKLADLHTRFQRMTFYISMRAMDTSYRMYELASKKAREHVYTVANASLKPIDAEPYNAENYEDTLRFLREITVPRVAKNAAVMHSNGLVHKYTNDINITALGSIVDLDSLRGETLGLGDDPVTPEDLWRDISEIMHALEVSGRSCGENIVKGEMLLRMQFAKLYGEELIARNNEKLLHDVSAVACAVMQRKHEEDETHGYYMGRPGAYISSDANTAERFLRAVTHDYAFNTIEKTVSEYNDWLRELDDRDLFNGLSKAVTEHLDAIAEAYLDNYYGFPIEGDEIVLIDMWLEGEQKEIFDEMMHDIIRDELGDFYLDSTSPSFDDPANTPETLFKETARQLMLRTCNQDLVRDEKFDDIYEKLYLDFSQKLREKTTITLHPSIFGPEQKSGMLGSSRNNVYARETNDMPLSSLFARLEEIKGEFPETLYYISSGEPRSMSYKPTLVSVALYEVITDGFLEGVFDSNSEERDLSLDASESASYIAFVERNETDRQDIKTIVHIYTISDEKPEQEPYALATVEALGAWLADKPIGQGKLFNPHEFTGSLYKDTLLIER